MPTGGSTPDTSSYTPDLPADDKLVEAARSLLEEADRDLRARRLQIDGLRGRGLQFTSFIGAATAFLLGTALDGSRLHELAAIVGTTCAIIAVFALVALLTPIKESGESLQVSAIMSNLETEAKNNQFNLGNHFATAACTKEWMFDQLAPRLWRLTIAYFVLVVFGIAQLGAWIWLVVWIHS